MPSQTEVMLSSETQRTLVQVPTTQAKSVAKMLQPTQCLVEEAIKMTHGNQALASTCLTWMLSNHALSGLPLALERDQTWPVLRKEPQVQDPIIQGSLALVTLSSTRLAIQRGPRTIMVECQVQEPTEFHTTWLKCQPTRCQTSQMSTSTFE